MTRLIVVLSFAWLIGLEARSAETTWKTACGSVAITPQEPVWMGGYAARTEPSDGKVHDLFAKVLVIQDPDGGELILVTTDLLGITPELLMGIEHLVSAQGVNPSSLLINASHTHCGPELRDDRIVRYGIDARYASRARNYVQRTAREIGKLILKTRDRVQPSRLFYSRARAGFAMNRRLPTEQGVINSSNPDGPIDHDVPVLRVESLDGKLRTILFGYACHATTLSFQKLCGDYPGFAQQYVQDAHPGAIAMFLNGCSADQNPYPRRTLDLAQQHGRALANGVETALQTRVFHEIHGPLRVEKRYATLRFVVPTREQIEAETRSSNKYIQAHGRELLRQLNTDGAIEAERNEFPVQVARFSDDLIFVAICGEVVVDYSIQLKKMLGEQYKAVWPAGYSNHVFGYLPSRRVLEEGGYEGGGAMTYTTYPGPFDATVEDRIMSTINELLNQVQTK